MANEKNRTISKWIWKSVNKALTINKYAALLKKTCFEKKLQRIEYNLMIVDEIKGRR